MVILSASFFASFTMACEANLFETEPIESRFDAELGQFVLTYWSHTTYRGDEFVTTVHRTYTANSLVDMAAAPDVLNRFYNEVSPLVNLANEKFESRREWKPEFSEKNIKVAKAYLSRSTYVVIRGHDGRLLGGIRNIEVRDDEALPEELFLKVKLPPMNTPRQLADAVPWKNEVGTLVVDETAPADLRRKVILEIWAHLFRAFFSKKSVRENYYDQTIHTYGDWASLLLYKPLGFKKLRRYVHNGVHVDYSDLAERDVPPILIKGEPWWPLVLLPKEAKALNQKFSNSERGRVSPQWLEGRRRQLADPWVSAFQFGAFFPHVLGDLQSKNESTFFAALKGLEEVIDSVSHHMDVAHRSFKDPETTSSAVDAVIEIRANLDELVQVLKRQLPGMSTERRGPMTLFAGRVLQMGNRVVPFMNVWVFFESVVFELLNDDSLETSELMMKYLMGARTPVEMIEQTGLALDLGQHAEGPEFIRDVEDSEAVLLARLAGKGHSAETIERVTRAMQTALFMKPRMIGDYDTFYQFDYSGAGAATVYLYLLPLRDVPTIQWIVQLAATRQYLADRAAQSRGGIFERGLSPGMTSDSESKAARARSVTKSSFLSRARAIVSTSFGK